MTWTWPGRGSSRPAPPSRLLPAYVGAIILGVLGMHALAQHCPMPLGHHASMTSAPIGAAMSGVSGAAGATAEHGHLAADSIVANRRPDLGAVAMLCGAMLLGVGAALLLRLRRRGGAAGRAQTRVGERVLKPRLRPAATGPPATLAFAVVRC